MLIADRARERGIATVYHAHAARLVHGTLTAPLVLTDGRELPPLTAATGLAREVEFAYPIPGMPVRGLVKGFIDALVAYDDDLWVLDYKSDRLATTRRAHASTRTSTTACRRGCTRSRRTGCAAARTLRGVLFAFVRHGIVVPVAIDERALATSVHWLEACDDPAVRAPAGGLRGPAVRAPAGGLAMIPLHPRGTLRARVRPRAAESRESRLPPARRRRAALRPRRRGPVPRRGDRRGGPVARRLAIRRRSASWCSR